MDKVLLFLVVAICATTIEACKKDPVHCVWNSWKYGACSAECGDGTRVDTRTKKVKEDHGGSCSGSSTRTVHCKEKECPVHCEWNPWVYGDCSKTCGGGVKTVSRTHAVKANHGGDECSGLSSFEESCNTQECPVDCVWGAWESDVCSEDCGGGVQPFMRVKTQLAEFGGIECEGEGFREDPCNTHPCPVDCTWNDWELGECSVTCGGGTRVDTRTVATPEMYGGTCDPEGDVKVEHCNTDKCPPIHCEWGEWVLGECSHECGVGTQTNTREKIVEELNGGTCTGGPTEVVECLIKECPIHCEWNDWEVTECDLPCGGGMLTKTRTEKVSAEHGGEACDGEHELQESCNVHECPVDCQWSEWTIGECSETCGQGKRNNHRTQFLEQFGGQPCEGEASVVEDCQLEECPVCPESKSTWCQTYVDVMPGICDSEWFTSPTGRYSCQKECNLC